MSHARLNRSEIVIVRSLAQRGGSTKPVSLAKWQREPALPLWRRGLVEIWYRQAHDSHPSMQGPFYGLTINGAYLASMFLSAPRDFSGAGSRHHD